MAKWTRNHILEIGSAVLAAGLALTIISFTYKWATPTPGWLSWYGNLVNVQTGNAAGDYNLIAFIVGPIMLIMGGFYVGEQIVLRRRFERLLDTPKKSEFASRRKDLDELARRLPQGYNARIDEKDAEFKSKRAV